MHSVDWETKRPRFVLIEDASSKTTCTIHSYIFNEDEASRFVSQSPQSIFLCQRGRSDHVLSPYRYGLLISKNPRARIHQGFALLPSAFSHQGVSLSEPWRICVSEVGTHVSSKGS